MYQPLPDTPTSLTTNEDLVLEFCRMFVFSLNKKSGPLTVYLKHH